MTIKEDVELIYRNAIHNNIPDCPCARCDTGELLVSFMKIKGIPISEYLNYKMVKEIIRQLPMVERVSRTIRNDEGKFKGNDYIEEIRDSKANEHRVSMKKIPVKVCKSCSADNPSMLTMRGMFCNRICYDRGY
jgi:hypothetical protein